MSSENNSCENNSCNKNNKQKKVNWHIIPTTTPLIIRHCSKCNKKMNFYCSEKFRLNGNHTRIDIWLIYKCIKCDTTWKLTIKKGIKPQDLPRELFEKFTHNDKDLAWKYAFDQRFLKQQDCVVDCSAVEYIIASSDDNSSCLTTGGLVIHLQSEYFFRLKLSALLSRIFGISGGELRKLVNAGVFCTNPACDIMKYRLKADLEVHVGNFDLI